MFCLKKPIIPLFTPSLRTFCIKKKPIFITTPIYYVNDKPHIGHLYTSLLADSLSRWFKLKEKSVFFSTGTDEHGLKIQQESIKNGISTKEHCDIHSSNFKFMFDQFNIKYDSFIRTTDQNHTNAVKHLWNTLNEKGYIEKGNYSGWYSMSDEQFLSNNDVNIDTEGNATSLLSGNKVEKTEESNYLFNMEKQKSNLLDHINNLNIQIEPKELCNQVLNTIKNLTPNLSISRDSNRVNWGINVPHDSSQTIYVWLDALVNYLSVCGYPNESYKEIWPPDYQILGKDITTFHCVYWPTFLLAADIPQPKKFICHAHWTKDKIKMSKSIKNIVDPIECLNKYTVDMLRFYLLLEGGISNDGDFSFKNLNARVNGDLCNHFGNLVSRSTSVGINPSQEYPHKSSLILSNCHEKLIKDLHNLYDNIVNDYENAYFNKGIKTIFSIIRECNIFFTENEPWKLAKKNEKEKLDCVLYTTYEIVRITSLFLQPIIPDTCDKILTKFNIPKERRFIKDGKLGMHDDLICGKKLTGEQIVLFNKI